MMNNINDDQVQTASIINDEFASVIKYLQCEHFLCILSEISLGLATNS